VGSRLGFWVYLRLIVLRYNATCMLTLRTVIELDETRKKRVVFLTRTEDILQGPKTKKKKKKQEEEEE
jgi:hypothetical protein